MNKNKLKNRVTFLTLIKLRKTGTTLDNLVEKHGADIAKGRSPQYELTITISNSMKYAHTKFTIKNGTRKTDIEEIGLPNEQLSGLKLDKLHIRLMLDAQSQQIGSHTILKALARFSQIPTRVLCFSDIKPPLVLRLLPLRFHREVVEFSFKDHELPDFLLFYSCASKSLTRIVVHCHDFLRPVGPEHLIPMVKQFRQFSLDVVPNCTVACILLGFYLSEDFGKMSYVQLGTNSFSIFQDQQLVLPSFFTLFELTNLKTTRMRNLDTKSIRLFQSKDAQKYLLLIEKYDTQHHAYWMFLINRNPNGPTALPAWLFSETSEAIEIRKSFPKNFSWAKFCDLWKDGSFMARVDQMFLHFRQ